tara:strand:- start:483 stop:710 length:228 start_codon:yes stop_codon:yes gene_type:complete
MQARSFEKKKGNADIELLNQMVLKKIEKLAEIESFLLLFKLIMERNKSKTSITQRVLGNTDLFSYRLEKENKKIY